MRICVLVFAAVMLATQLSSAASHGLDLVSRDGTGKPTYTIVVGRCASQCERYAAEELQSYLQKISGCRLSVATDERDPRSRMILLGRTRFTEQYAPGTDYSAIGPDGFRLKANGGNLVVAADTLDRSGAGVLYGVYEVLERFGGCGWFSSWHEVVPKSQSVIVPADLDDVQSPAFDMRVCTWRDVHSNVANAYRNRLNPSFGKAAKFGGSRNLFSPVLGVAHTFSKIVPASKYFKDHPEYFAEVRGARRAGQLCLSNPDVLKIATGRVREEIARCYPKGIRFYGVSQNDGNEDYCRCEKCRALDEAEGTPAASIIRFANAIAEAIEADYPDVIIETLAYTYSVKPPKTLKPRHNVMPCVCTIRCDFSKGIPSSRYKVNVEMADMIRKWGVISKHFYLWDYTTDFSAYMYPFPNVRTLRENVRFFRGCGVTRLYEQGNYTGFHGDWAELKGWLLGKYMWNPDVDEEPLLTRFFKGFYGPAADEMRNAFDAEHSLVRDERRHPLHIYECMESAVVPDEFLEEQSARYAKAYNLVKGTRYSRNVAYQAISVDVPRVIRYFVSDEYGFMFCSRHPERVKPERFAKMRDLTRQILAVVDEPGLRPVCLAEGGKGKRYLKMLRDFMKQTAPTQPVDRVKIEENLLGRSIYPDYVSYVDDPAADNGSAYHFSHVCYEWAGDFDVSSIMTDSDGVYKMRVRLRANVKPGAKPDDEVFWSGVYNYEDKKAAFPSCSLKVKDIKDGGYHWYDIGEWTPKRCDHLWSGGGRFADRGAAHSGCWIDCFELVRIK